MKTEYLGYFPEKNKIIYDFYAQYSGNVDMGKGALYNCFRGCSLIGRFGQSEFECYPSTGLMLDHYSSIYCYDILENIKDCNQKAVIVWDESKLQWKAQFYLFQNREWFRDKLQPLYKLKLKEWKKVGNWLIEKHLIGEK